MREGLRLWGAMIASIVLVAVVMFYDEQREFEISLAALQDEQSSLATAVGADFEARLNRIEEGDEVPGEPPTLAALVARLIGGARELEQPHSRLILIDDPQLPSFLTAGGRRIASAALRDAVHRDASEVVLPREAASEIGLPHRVAVAAIRKVEGESGTWSVIVVASAERLRAREHRAELRFLLGVCVVTVLVASFGGLALRDQRRKLAVARQLEVSALRGERERLLAKADKMTTLAALSSGIAHQVATPLGIIVARIEQVLPNVADDPRASAALAAVSEQVNRIQQVIRGVLALSRGNRTALLETQPEVIVRSALDAVEHRLQQAGVRAELVIERGDNSPLLCDPPLLEQALVNLLLNACEASRAGDVIGVRVERAPGCLRFVIQDNGEGIRADIATGAREPFFSTKPEGTGLGLAIASEIASHHGGKLLLERRRGRGTRALIELPQQ